MKIYVVVGVFQGVIDEVNGFTDVGEADTDLAGLKIKYEIMPGKEEESENDVKLFEIEVPDYPTSVAVRMKSI